MAEEKMTFEELAEKTGLSRLHLIYLFEGDREFKVSEIFAVAKALDLSDDQMVRIFFQ